MKKKISNAFEDKLKKILEANQIQKDLKQKIVLCGDSAHLVIEVGTLIRLESIGNYTAFYLNDGRKIISSKTLKKYDGQLPESSFFRIFRSHVININYVTSFSIAIKSTVTMSDGETLELSRDKKKKFFKLMNNL